MASLAYFNLYRNLFDLLTTFPKPDLFQPTLFPFPIMPVTAPPVSFHFLSSKLMLVSLNNENELLEKADFERAILLNNENGLSESFRI